MKKMGPMVVGLMLASCTGGSGLSNREACEKIGQASLNAAIRCGMLEGFTEEQYRLAIIDICCDTDDCSGPDGASDTQIESCAVALEFQECFGEEALPAACEGIWN